MLTSGKLENGKHRIKRGDYYNKLKPGNRFIFFLSRVPLKTFTKDIQKDFWKRKNKIMFPYLLPESIENFTTLSIGDFTSIYIDSKCNLHMEDKQNLLYNLAEVKSMIKTIYVINDPLNFYSRSYK